MNSSTGTAPARTTPLSHPGATRRKGLSRFEIFLQRLGTLTDALIGVLALVVAIEIHSHFGETGPAGIATYLACAAFWVIVLMLNWLERHQRSGLFPPGMAMRSIAVSAAVVFSVLFFVRSVGFTVSRMTVLIFAASGLALLTAWHRLAASRLAWLHGRDPGRVVLIGDPALCEDLAERMQDPLSYTIPQVLQTNAEANVLDLLAKLEALLRSSVVDEVLFASSMFGSDPALAGIWRGALDLCEATGTNLRIYSRWMENHGYVYLDSIAGNPILTFSFASESHWQLLVKRCLDVVFSATALILTAPVLLLAAVAVRSDSPGPIIFRQTRCGLRGRTFTLYKLRSMRPDAESLKSGLAQHNEMKGPVFKMTHDPRVTRVGRWLRRSSIDELPQLVNVLRGEMSLVGPRPPLPSEVRLYSLADLRRLAMKPGITGLWQVSGRNGVSQFKDWVELDAAYIREWSLWLDMKIMVKTVLTVLRMSGK